MIFSQADSVLLDKRDQRTLFGQHRQESADKLVLVMRSNKINCKEVITKYFSIIKKNNGIFNA